MISQKDLETHYQIPVISDLALLEHIKTSKKQEIDVIKNKISQYQNKKKAEEAFYNTLSPIRKFFAGRPPSHHLAVEYIVHVKERIKQIDALNQQILELDRAMKRLSNGASLSHIEFSSKINEEIRLCTKSED
ncbi:hypothetical protein GMB86_03810 [Terrilactibacillus sp. BCM23-1]|uniref:Uncharacterized protein n=1 Tax=Terrilactibacillus tamarindi TaxID=2599694 RepID=A0A6N8CM96_9BACI|nr:hypothetical protein [Terrilactibacillus tamarindi]MTT31139.1 hypothetical protein [Terrilactibacillus tamarindi]